MFGIFIQTLHSNNIQLSAKAKILTLCKSEYKSDFIDQYK